MKVHSVVKNLQYLHNLSEALYMSGTVYLYGVLYWSWSLALRGDCFLRVCVLVGWCLLFVYSLPLTFLHLSYFPNGRHFSVSIIISDSAGWGNKSLSLSHVSLIMLRLPSCKRCSVGNWDSNWSTVGFFGISWVQGECFK